MFLRSGNSMVTLSELYHHRFTSKIQFEPEVLELQGYPSFSLVEFYDFTYIYVFEVEEFNGDTFKTLPPLSWPRKSSLNRKYWELWGYPSVSLVEFYNITYIYVFEVEEFNGGHFQNSTTTGWPRKSNSNRKYWNFKVTHLSPWWNFMILPIFVFSRSRNSMVPLSKLYHHWLTSKIQFEPEILELWGYPSFSLVEFHHSTCIYVFEVEEFNSDTFRIIPPPVDLENSVRTGRYWNFEVTHLFQRWNFMILPMFMFSSSRNSIATLSEL